MTSTPPPPALGAPPPFRPELTRLVEVGVLGRALVGDGARDGAGAFDELARDATRAGVVTPEQARALAALLGLSMGAANDSCGVGESVTPSGS